MSTALVLAEDGRRENGRWRRNTLTDNQQSLDSDSFKEYLRRAGIVLDYTPDAAHDGSARLVRHMDEGR